MFFERGFAGSSSLAYVIFPTRARDMVDFWIEHRVGFIFF
jgi:hypothetical protein